MPSESAFNLASGSALPNGFDMDMDVKNEDFLDHFNDFDMLLPAVSDEELLESRLSIDNPFLDSLLDEDNHWSDFIDAPITNGDSDVFVKLEPHSPGDSPRSLSCSESGSSCDGKFVLETPPVSPPVLDTTQLTPLAVRPQTEIRISRPEPKSSVLNPSSMKLVQNVKGLKQPSKRTKVILPKEVVQKVVNIKSKPPVIEAPQFVPVTSAPPTITIAKPVIIPSSHMLSGNGIAICQSNKVKSVQISRATLTSLTNPSSVMPVIKQEMNAAQKHDLKLKALKRQQRMIKNRESACLSRKKKKEYVTTLESAVSNLEEENAKLRMENTFLKSRVKELEAQFDELPTAKAFLNSNLRKTTAVLAVLFMVSINIGSMGIISRESRPSELQYHGPGLGGGTRIGRTLLWVPEGRDNITNATSKGPTCPLRINQTESLRLEKELRSWIAVDEKRVRYRNASAAYRPKPSLRQLILHNNIPSAKPTKTQKIRASFGALDFYRPPFPGALPRRDDTFYVFSFSSDHLLVPAVAHNNTVRPKMSFVIPTVPLNDTVIKNGLIPMMQIDCEVLATHSLQFTEKDFKLIKPVEKDQGKNQSTEAKYGPSSFKPYFIHRKRLRTSPEYYDSFDLHNKDYRSPHNSFP